MKEIWKDIEGMEGMYQVSNLGQVKSLQRTIHRKSHGDIVINEKILRGSIDTKGYIQIEARINGKRVIKFVHRLVADAFIPKPQDATQVNHINGNKLDNTVSNLEWVTCKENIHHAWETNLNHALKGEAHGNHKLTEEQVRYIKTHYIKRDKEFGAKALARKFGVTTTPILLIVRGKAWRHVKEGE